MDFKFLNRKRKKDFNNDYMNTLLKAGTKEVQKLTKEQFEAGYIEKSDIDVKFYNKRFITLLCNCKEKGCNGFAAVSNTDICIKAHNDLYRK